MMKQMQGCEHQHGDKSRRGGVRSAAAFLSAIMLTALMPGCNRVMDFISPPRVIEPDDYPQTRVDDKNLDASPSADAPATIPNGTAETAPLPPSPQDEAAAVLPSLAAVPNNQPDAQPAPYHDPPRVAADTVIITPQQGFALDAPPARSQVQKIAPPDVYDTSLPTAPPPQVTGITITEATEPALTAVPVAAPEPAPAPQPQEPVITAVVPSVEITPVNVQTLRQPAVMQPAAAPEADPLAQTIAQMEQAVRAAPDDVNAQVTLRCLYAQQGRREQALAPLPLIAPEKQTQALNLVRAILLTASGEPRSSEDANAALAALQDLSGQVADKADLYIKNLKLCRKVDGFGQYELFDLPQFSEGQPTRPLIYCELENFQSRKDADGRYTTQLKAWMTIYDSQYAVVAQRIADVTDVPSFNPRRDFFLRGSLDVPALPKGLYRVEVRIEDKVAGKIARPAHLEFEVK